MYTINYSWKQFNINTPKAIEAMQALIQTQIVASCCNSSLQVHFNEEPTQEEKDLIQMYWDDLIETSTEATSYKSSNQIKQETETAKQALKDSAKVKLATLGLSNDEINAIIGGN
jgi:hypothetical protein